MKHIQLLTLFIAFTGLATSLFSGVTPPRPSLLASTTQKIGLTDITITYSRPNTKDREIFGELVPFGEVWRTGANWATTIELETNATLGGHDLSQGKYSLFTIPGEENWTVIINSKPDQFGAFSYDSTLDVFRFEVPAQKLPTHLETFSIQFSNTHDNQADIEISWADTFISFEVSVSDETNHKQMMASIQESVIDNEGNLAWGDLGEAARYYVKTNFELDTAVIWLTQCVELNPNAWWMIGEKAQLLKQLERNKEAIAAANEMLAYCENIQNEGGIGWANELLASLK